MKTRGKVAHFFVAALSFILSLVVFFGAWQLAAEYWIRPVWISSPKLVADRFGTWVANGMFIHNTWITTKEALLGLVIGVALGAIGGILLAQMPKLISGTLDPYVIAAYTLPRVALAPFFVIWFGIGLESKVLLVVSIVFFITLFNVRQGMGSIDRELVDALRSMRAPRRTMLRRVVLPSLMPWIVSSVKICIGAAMIGAIIGELFGATGGLGWLVTQSLASFDMTGAILSMMIMTIVACVMFYLVVIFERYAFRWNTQGANALSSVI
ncbi:MAG: ABC transporter permease [Acidimicrobiales bacterium]